MGRELCPECRRNYCWFEESMKAIIKGADGTKATAESINMVIYTLRKEAEGKGCPYSSSFDPPYSGREKL